MIQDIENNEKTVEDLNLGLKLKIEKSEQPMT